MSAADSSGPHTAHAVHPPPRRFAGAGLIAALLILAVVVAGCFLFWQMDRAKPPPATQSEVALLRERLAADEARLAALEKPDDGAKTALAQSRSDLAALADRVGKLETTPDPQAAARLDASDRRLADLDLRLATLERGTAGADLVQRLTDLQAEQAALAARIAHLESLDASVTLKRAAAALALANLVRGSATASAFTAELAAFAALMPGTPEAADLAAIAPHGAPTEALLAARFPAAAAQALAAERAAGARTWLGRLWANIGNLVVVRRIGERPGRDSDAVLARAGARLNGGDLDGAIAELDGLAGAARASIGPWLHDARARAAIARDTAGLARRMAALLAAP
ncbi:MAG: mitofilin family membrane protein [Rhizomicrobium sp.]